MLDGGGARLADAATRHHLTHTTRKRKHGEQNKHQGTQTIQKTSPRQSTTNGHHTLPSMRNQTPIQQQRTTQTQQCRGRPHNPSLTRRKQPPRQRASPLCQMQQQTRQRQGRKRKSTPLPEKRRRKRQTTHRSHANTTLRHMVNHPPPFQQQERRCMKKQETKRREHNKKNTMVFGDNVRARMAARALPRTPPTRQRKKRKKTNEETAHTTHHPPVLHTATRQHSNTKRKRAARHEGMQRKEGPGNTRCQI